MNIPSISTARLYGIVDLGYTPMEHAVPVTAELLAGGVGILQLRAKGHNLTDIGTLAGELKHLCKAAGVPFVLNDYPAVAAALDLDGVHIGQDDGDFAEARELMGPGKIVGRSTHSLDQARAALADGFDYIGFGPIFPTATKAGRQAIGLHDIAAMEREVGSKIPAFCIGGINPGTLPQVLDAGARRVVVVSALLQAPYIAAATRELLARIPEIA